MKRRNELTLEQRMNRVRKIREKQILEEQKEISQNHSSFIYKLAIISSIITLSLSLFVGIDWLLPNRTASNKITVGYTNKTKPASDFRSKEEQTLVITLANLSEKVGLKIKAEQLLPQANDSVLVSKSLILNETKIIKDITNKETYSANTITYYLLSVFIALSILALLFFIYRNMPVKAFYYIIFGVNFLSLIGLVIATYIFSRGPMIY